MKKNKIIYALYDDDKKLINGLKILVKEKIKIKEVYTPFPIHSLSKILKIKKTKISDFAFIYGILGFLFSCILTWYIMIYDWPQNIGGKPNFFWYLNLPSFIPVIFELTIFFSSHLMVVTYLYKNKLYPGKKHENPDPRTTDDKFLVEIFCNDIDNIKKLLISTNVEEIRIK